VVHGQYRAPQRASQAKKLTGDQALGARHQNYKHLRSTGVVLLCIVLSMAIQRPASPEPANKALKVGFVLVGPISDYGWNAAHNEGRRVLEKTLGDKVQTLIAENVPENATAERVMEKMIAQDAKLLFCTSYGYLEPALRVAQRHPDVVIMQCQRSSSAKNVGHYFAKQFEPLYVAGFIAGRMTKTNKIGYVGGQPVPTVLSALNGLALGAKAANPKVVLNVVWVNSWYDPAAEAEAAKGLIESGADVIAATNSTTVVPVAEKLHVMTIGCNGDYSKLAPKHCLTSQLWNWGPLYTKIAQSVIDHTWRPTNTLYGMKDGYVELSAIATAVPQSIKMEANSLKKTFVEGKAAVFQGPMKDRDGKLRIQAGKTADTKMLETMDWVVDGVRGSLPK
jgi:basic membrane protein A and related proteins